MSATPVKINDRGEIKWKHADVFTFRCTVNTRFYPIDTQVCYLDFVTKGYRLNELVFVSISDEVAINRFEEDVEWELLSAISQVSVFNAGGISTQVFRNTLTLKRRSAFIVVHSLTPVILLSILNILVFILPAES